MNPCQSLSNVTLKLACLLMAISHKLYHSPRERQLSMWRKDRGDQTLRLNYELTPTSVVFDVGGYEGQWASDIFSMYCCTIHVFEPVQEFATKIEHRFRNNPHILLHVVGLSDETKSTSIVVDQDASSVFKTGNRLLNIKLMCITDFIREENINQIDLMKINIEGGEYDLLKHLIDTGLIKNITNLQVQFHDFVPQAKQKMQAIQKSLQETHVQTYQYPFVWENWRAKNRV